MPQQNFRDKEAFIIIYDMGSKIQCSRLKDWYIKIRQEATEEKSVLLFLGNSAENGVEMELLKNAQAEIRALHREQCETCCDLSLCP
jgi:hypothetical protein